MIYKIYLLLILFCIKISLNGQKALQFDGVNDYLAMGSATGLATPVFTLECWIKKTGSGVSTSTGTGGITAVPIITKGRSESDGSNKDCNYFLGITAAGQLTADFEETTPGPNPGLNHPVIGVNTITNNVWFHIAVTYDGTWWKLFINGVLDKKDSVGRTPQGVSIQHFAIGSALNSTGVASGYFAGVIDNVRVWNIARKDKSIADSAYAVFNTAPGLIGCYNMEEGTGTTTANTGSAGTLNGTLTNGPTWVTGAIMNRVPSVNLISPINNAINQPIKTILTAGFMDGDNDSLTIEYWGRLKPKAIPKFTILPLPDMQFYHGAKNGGTAKSGYVQTQWIADNTKSLNIVYSVQLGDCVELGDNGGNDIEWRRADSSFKYMEDKTKTGLSDGLPYGICVGNHDQSPVGDARGTTTFYNQYFGKSRFAGRAYYGGNYGTNNDNHFELFSASGFDFIAINLEYDNAQDTFVLRWADSLLKKYANRKAIVSSHWLINADASWGPQGAIIYNKLKFNANLFLMLCGHINPNGEAQRTDVFNGNTVYTLLSDFQNRANGGSGWLRIMEFFPSQNICNVKTYSPILNTFETDANSQFSIPLNFTNFPYKLLKSFVGKYNGQTINCTWDSLMFDTLYQWYVVVKDKYNVATSNINEFITVSSLSSIKFESLVANVNNYQKNIPKIGIITLKTNNQTSIQQFILTRSTNNIVYDSLKFIKPVLNSSVNTTYTFIDSNLLSNLNYYKVKAIGKDGIVYVSGMDTLFNDTVFYPTPIVNLGNDLTICAGTFTTLDAKNNGSTYIWNNNTALNTQKLSINTAGKYKVKVTNIFGFSAEDSVQVNINPKASLSVTKKVFETCENQKLSIDVISADSITWKNLNSNNFYYGNNLAISEPGVYQVIANNAYNCPKIDTISVVYNPKVNVNLGNDFFINQGTNVFLDAGNPGSLHTWNTGEKTQKIKVIQAGVYWVSVQNSFGCKAADTIKLMTNLGVNAKNRTPFVIQIFPNPTSGGLNISCKSQNTEKIATTIINISGKKMLETQDINLAFGKEFNPIKGFEDIPAGIYFVHIKHQNFATVFKVSKIN